MAKKREYTPEFKREAVRLADERGNRSAVARELGIHLSVLRRWGQEFKESGDRAFPGKGNPKDEELARLRREPWAHRGGERRFKKGCGYLHEPPSLRYQFIEEHRGQFSITVMCRAIQVSTSGYYDWRRRPESANEEDEALLEKVKAVYASSKRRYGSPRVHRKLRQNGIRCGRNRVARLMREHNLRARRARRFKVTTDSKHSLPIAENVLEQQFEAEVPNARWAADITYIWTREGWLYLAVVIDLFSRRVVGWSMKETMERSLVIAALEMALRARTPSPGLLHAPRSRKPVCQRRLPASAAAGRLYVFDEPQGQLLGQRTRGELLLYPKDGTRT